MLLYIFSLLMVALGPASHFRQWRLKEKVISENKYLSIGGESILVASD